MSTPFFQNLFLLILGLRLTDHIDWAWYWVALPLLFACGTQPLTVRLEKLTVRLEKRA